MWHHPFFLPETPLIFMGAMASITFITLELKLFIVQRSLTETEGRAGVAVKALVNNIEVFPLIYHFLIASVLILLVSAEMVILKKTQ